MLRIVNALLPHERRWTQSRLIRPVKAYVHDGLLPDTVLGRAGRRLADDRLPAIVAAIKGADPGITPLSDLRALGGNARTHALWVDQLAAFIGQDDAGTC